jgi:hypothetical protein
MVVGKDYGEDQGYHRGLTHGVLIGIALGLLLTGAVFAGWHYHLALMAVR